ncbi:hypothetical protein FGG08_006801 [Glutinoglossum americanum]|uniref:OPA3-like protein n=1 Tax=Glutinoglossum americanum TaxID=1670608 RepID=A0A9P8HXJ5_9PEZI|nr:hypothetical protein FGG08_006801 [Glutinoglossum americanum]
MSSITLKITSLIIRTLSKPIANQIKNQAREHPRFRKLCVDFAQSLHRVDMHLRLGLIRNAPQAERHAARDPAEIVQARKLRLEAAEKAKDGAADATAKTDEAAEKAKEKLKPTPKPRIRPLTEAKAIDTGATFISEAFLFFVTGSLIVFESWRSRRKATTRREDIADRLTDLAESERLARQALAALEKEVLRLRMEREPTSSATPKRILPKEVWTEGDAEAKDEGKPVGWWKWMKSFGPKWDRARAGADLAQRQDEKEPEKATYPASSPKCSDETPGKGEPLATRIAHSVASMRKDATPPPTSPTGETEAIIDSTS